MASFSIESNSTAYTKWDRYPVISTVYSGPAGIAKGFVQIISGIALGILTFSLGWTKGLTVWKNDMNVNLHEFSFGIQNLGRGCIALVPIIGNLTIHIYEKSPFGPYILERDSKGLYVVPHFSVEGFTNAGNMRMKEVNIRSGDFVIDTQNRIVPKGWILRA